MSEIIDSKLINGVQVVQLTAHPDQRGRFVETFRKAWFPQREFGDIQMNASYSDQGVIRGLHYHHRQIDYWYLVSGKIRVGMCDLRQSSPTFKATETIDLDADDPKGVYIPVGVAHGFLTLTDIVLTYLVDNYYDGTDENAVAWHDPEIGIDWGAERPTLSERDSTSPLFKDIDPANMPK
ncbi:MAG: dTDP-4-dehydrorhamnose 3,5-epimerase [Gemmatimonadetes bacterium]|nr:dTDP-4-dehydrorhamnose 3,5-epimerase [Gemmatimonadota bacterium]|tara:strand:- start:2933 stop:3472 length:540 start_codon:yes stop_codon:yes gene_type:complete